MTVHLYLTLVPEAMIASMLPPEEFGTYFSVGITKKQHGQTSFVELDPDFRHPFFRIEEALARCVPHPDGRPKRSVYVANYRVLEHVPLGAYNLYSLRPMGRACGWSQPPTIPPAKRSCTFTRKSPITPLVVSTAPPYEFCRFLIHEPDSMVHLPAVAFVELQLGELAMIQNSAPSVICPMRAYPTRSAWLT